MSKQQTIAASASNSEAQIKALQEHNAELGSQVKSLQKQLDVFKKMLFGKRSEKRPFDIPEQPSLFDDYETGTEKLEQPEPAKKTVTYERGTSKKARAENCVTAEGLRFDDDVPVKRIKLTPAIPGEYLSLDVIVAPLLEGRRKARR